jgi:hypothetical protein
MDELENIRMRKMQHLMKKGNSPENVSDSSTILDDNILKLSERFLAFSGSTKIFFQVANSMNFLEFIQHLSWEQSLSKLA